MSAGIRTRIVAAAIAVAAAGAAPATAVAPVDAEIYCPQGFCAIDICAALNIPPHLRGEYCAPWG